MSPNPPPAGPPGEDVHLIVATDEEVVVEKHPEDWMAIALFWVLAFIVFLQFFTRYVLNNSLAWTEEIARYLLMVTVFVGGAMVVRRNTNIAVELVQNVMKDGGLKRALIGAVEIVPYLTVTGYGGFLGSAELPLVYQYEPSPVCIWKSTNGCGHAPQPAVVRFWGDCPDSGSTS